MQMIRRLLLLLCAIGLAASGVGMTLAYANNGNPTLLYDGREKTLTILNTTETDLFTDLKDLMPGDTRTQQIDLQAQNLQRNTALFLKAECDEETALALAPLTLSVYAGDTLVDSAPAGGSEALRDGVLLHLFSKNETVPLRVELEVPVTVGNELEDARHHLQWVFTAQEQEVGPGDDTPGAADGNSAEVAPDAGAQAPTAGTTGAVTLIPQTGDRAPVGVWQILFCLSAAGLVALRLAQRKTADQK